MAKQKKTDVALVANDAENEKNVVDIFLDMCSDIKGLCRADLIDPVKVIPTKFTGFNRASRIGGFPLSCIHITHGPQHAGKSLLEMVKCMSAADRGHIAVWLDAEQVFDKKFYTLLGGDLSKLVYRRPSTYEETIKEVDILLKQFRVMKEKDLVNDDTCLFIVVDSLTKLMPEKLMKEVLSEKDDVNKQFKLLGLSKAMFNQGWFDHLTPLVGNNDVAISFITQERTNKIDMGGASKGRGPIKVEYQDKKDWKLKGGAAVLYDNSLQSRVTVESDIWCDKTKAYVGKKHKVHIVKNKVGYPDEVFYFHFYNGTGDYPLGIDYERTLIEDLDKRGYIDTAGAWKGVKIPGLDTGDEYIVRRQGVDKLAQALKDDIELYNLIVSHL